MKNFSFLIRSVLLSGAAITLISCGGSSPSARQDTVMVPPVAPPPIPTPTPEPVVPEGPFTYASIAVKNPFTMNCTAAFSAESCSQKPVKRAGGKCSDGRFLLQQWAADINGSTAPVGKCVTNQKELLIDCDEICRLTTGNGGLCLTRSVVCYGERVPSGYCSCGL